MTTVRRVHPACLRSFLFLLYMVSGSSVSWVVAADTDVFVSYRAGVRFGRERWHRRDRRESLQEARLYICVKESFRFHFLDAAIISDVSLTTHPALVALGMGKKVQRAWVVLDDFNYADCVCIVRPAE